MSARTFTLELPAGLRLLSANSRPHWSTRAAITHDIRKAAWACAKQAAIPPLERAAITVEYQPPPNGRHRDADNLAPSAKAAIDGAVDAHVLPGDDSRYLAGVTFTIGEPFPRGRLVLHITEAAGGH